MRAVLDVAVSPDGGLIATASSSGTVRLWDAPTDGRSAGPLAHQASVTSVAFRPDGRVLLDDLAGSLGRGTGTWPLVRCAAGRRRSGID